jgi:DNA replication protein
MRTIWNMLVLLCFAYSAQKFLNKSTGKTHLAIALGMEAIRKGYSVRFCRACDLATQLAEAESEKRLNGTLKSLHRCQLLCLDELCEASHNSSYGKYNIMQS